jgi:hypothetical protein
MSSPSAQAVKLGYLAVGMAVLAQKEDCRAEAEKMIELAYAIFDQANLNMPQKLESKLIERTLAPI